MILDTDFLLDLIDGKRPAFAKSRELHESNESQKVSTISVLEIFYGAYYTEDEDELRKVKNLLYMYDVIDNTSDVSKVAASLIAEADRSHGGNSGVGYKDAIIGASAKVNSDSVMTRNIKDFSKLDVDIESYELDE